MRRFTSSLYHAIQGSIAIGGIALLSFAGLAAASQLAGHGFSNHHAQSAAYAQIVIPDEDNNTTISTALENNIQNASTFLLRGFIGSTVQVGEAGIAAGGGRDNRTDQDDGYVITGRWRLLVNETLVQRFVANMTVAKIDGSESRNIIIENIPTRPGIERNDNNTTIAELDAKIYLNEDSAASITAPVRLEVIGDSVIRLAPDIEERMIENEDIQQLEILRQLEGSAIYGSIEFQEMQ